MSVKTVLVSGLLCGLANAAACVTADKRDVTRSVHIQQQTMAGKPVPVIGCPDDFNSEQCSKYSSKQASLFSSLSAASTSSNPAPTPAVTTFPITSTVSISMSTSKPFVTVPAPVYNEPGVYTVYSHEMELTFRHVTGNNDDLTTCDIDPSSVQETASDTIAVTCADGNVWEFYVAKLHVAPHARNVKKDHHDHEDHDHDHDHDENAKTMASNVWDCFHNGNCKRAASTPAVERATVVVKPGEQKSILVSMIDDCSSSKSHAARATTSTPPPVVIVTSTTTMSSSSTSSTSSQAFTLPPPKPSTTIVVPAVTVETVTVQDTMMFPDTVTIDVTTTIDPMTLLPSFTNFVTEVGWPAGFSLRPTTEQFFIHSVVEEQVEIMEEISSSAPLPAPGAAVRGGLVILAGLVGVGAFML